MSLLNPLPIDESTVNGVGQVMTEQLAQDLDTAEHTIETLSESLADLELMLEDRSWRSLGWGEHQFSRDGLTRATRLCRVMAVANPLIRRGLSLRAAYVWGGGVALQAKATGDDDDPAVQDVNTVVQGFLDDPATVKALGGTARETNERALGTDGNLFVALFTHPRTGRVQPRVVLFDEVVDVVKNPEDASEVWFYKRVRVVPGRGETITTYHPDVDYRPRAARALRLRALPGQQLAGGTGAAEAGEVMWDAPVIHLKVNAQPGWDFGVPDGFAAIAWARSYKEFLEDWAKLVKALSRFAWRATSDRRSKAQTAAAAIRQSPSVSSLGDVQDVGAAVSMGPGQSLEAIPKTGATIDSESGRPLAAMVAAGLDVPVTMLLADPGTTGNRATAETLDTPTELIAGMRREAWGDFWRRLLGYVVDAAVKAPGGALSGTVGRDEWGREVVELAGGTSRTIEVDWPDLTDTPVNVLMDAIERADGIGKLPPLLIVRLLLQALKVRDADEWLQRVTGEDGEFVDPEPDRTGGEGGALVTQYRAGQRRGQDEEPGAGGED